MKLRMRYTGSGWTGVMLLLGSAVLMTLGGSVGAQVYALLPVPVALGGVLVMTGRELVSQEALQSEDADLERRLFPKR